MGDGGPRGARLEIRQTGACGVLAATGELDAASADQLGDLVDGLVAAGARSIVVDLSKLLLLDCAALGALVAAGSRLPAGGRLRTTGAHGRVLEVMEITGVAKRLGAHDPPEPDCDRQPPGLGPHASDPDRQPSESGHDGQPLAEAERLLVDLAALPPGDPSRHRVRERAIAAALPFAEQLANRYRSRGPSVDDLRQVAYLGMIKAVDGYAPELGHRLVSYAIPTVLGEIRRYFRDQTWGVHVPRRLQELRPQISVAVDELTQRLGRSPTIAQLAGHLHLGEEQIIEAEVASLQYQPVSLSQPVREDGGELVDVLGDRDPDLEQVDLHLALSASLDTLPRREQRIIAMRFYGNCSQSQIGKELGISQMHVSRLLGRALARLRRQLLADA